jgi:hypothetical protein
MRLSKKGASFVPMPSARRTFPVLVLVAQLATACAGGSTGSPELTAVPGSPSPSAGAASIPVVATPAGSVAPARSGEPPPASLRAEGGDPVAGQLGSYTWGDAGSDSPWLEGAPIRVGAGEPLTVVLDGDPPVDEWSAQRVAAGTSDGSGAMSLGSAQGAPIAFLAPGPGRWSVQVLVRFAGGSDSAAWYWLLDVR